MTREINKDDWRQKFGVKRQLKPSLPEDDLAILQNSLNTIICNFAKENVSFQSAEARSVAQHIRQNIQANYATLNTKISCTLSLYADLIEQGWTLADLGTLTFEPPGNQPRVGETIDAVKDRIRSGLIAGQTRQLSEPSVKSFLKKMYHTPKHGLVNQSIDAVIDDAAEINRILQIAAKKPDHTRGEYLKKHFAPEIQICTTNERCEHTGLKLLDIWRFFRHTWLTEYRPIPGRQLPILIRNGARKNKPIMGLAMLASPVMRMGVRDKWIGWENNVVVDKLFDGKIDHEQFIASMYKRLEMSIGDIRYDDLISVTDLKDPTSATLDLLTRQATIANEMRAQYLRDVANDETGELFSPKDPNVDKMSDEDWLRASEEPLYVEKRASTLATLLEARMILNDFALADNSKNLGKLITSKLGYKAFDTVMNEFRKDGMANDVMDLSICGAVPPYGSLLTGKLTALLMLSREVNDAYKARYGNQIRIIASQMSGKAITKATNLKVITTTSLFGNGTSQYNRLKLRAADHHGITNDLNFEKLGDVSAGFGTLQISSETQQLLRKVSIETHGARRINSRFGEGTSARLRQAREGLTALGLEPNNVLHHATPRIVLGCKATKDIHLNLLGLTETKEIKRPSVQAISRAWIKRWLARRVLSEEVRNRVSNETKENLKAKLLLE